MTTLKVCSGCYKKKDVNEFLSKNTIRATCNSCRNKNLNVKKRQKCEETFFVNNNEENPRLPSQLSNIIYEYLLEINEKSEFLENEGTRLVIGEILHLEPLIEELPTTLTEEEKSKRIAVRIINLASEGDGYQYVYHSKHIQKNTILFHYWCNMRVELNKHSVKHEDPAKQRDTDSRIQRHSCGGCISIKIDYQNSLIFFKLEHILHTRPDHIEVTDIIKKYIHSNIRLSAPEIFYRIKEQKLQGYEMLTKGQVYYWWTREAALEYKRDVNEIISAKKLLQEKGYLIVFQTKEPIESFAFITPFLSHLPRCALETIVADATYNTNSMKHELYGIMGVIDGTSFPLSYLLVSAGKNRPITKILMGWFSALKEHGINNVKTFLTDKDMAQINAAISIWPNAHVQLCLWHVKRAVEQHLSSKKKIVQIRYNAQEAHNQCSVIDPYWQPSILCTINFSNNNSQIKQTKSKVHTQILCIKSQRDEIIQRIEQHFHRHMLIPTINKDFITNPQEIWTHCVGEMFRFCYQNNLQMEWAYLWDNWYNWSQFCLWARCTFSEIIVHKTTMLIESHWRTLKRDHLYKFARPRLDLLCFIITDKVVSQQLERYYLLCNGREQPSWRKDFKSEWRSLTSKMVQNREKYLTDQHKWICSCPYFLVNRFLLCKHLVAPMGRMENAFFKKVSLFKLIFFYFFLLNYTYIIFLGSKKWDLSFYISV
jgi:hypothetical protein